MVETKFKQTDVGLIPEDWEVKKLVDCSKIFRGGSPRPIEAYITEDINGVNWIKIGDVEPTTKYIFSTAERIKSSGISSTRLVYSGDLILSNSMSFGRPYILKIDGAIHDGWLVIQDYEKTFNVDFLYYALSSEMIMMQYKASAAGSSVQNLNKDKVGSVVVCTPPTIAEQERIASALTSIDNLISSLDKQIAKTRNIKQGAMQQLLASFYDEASIKSIDEVAKIIRGVRVTKGQLMQNGKYPVVSGGTGYMGYINEYNREPNTITIAQYGTAGYVNWQEQKFWANDICFCVMPNTKLVLNKYLYYSLESRQEYLYSISNRDATPYSIDRKKILNVRIPVPSIEEQQRIASTLTAMDNQIAALEAKRRKYEMLKQGMMQQLLTGKIRLSQ